MKHGFHYYTCFLSPTLNNTSTSLGGDDYLGTLNPKLSRTKCKFSEGTCLILQNKKIKNKENRFSFMWKPEVNSPSDSHNQPCQTSSHYENYYEKRVKSQVKIWKSPKTGLGSQFLQKHPFWTSWVMYIEVGQKHIVKEKHTCEWKIWQSLVICNK
jgi:hypothetical protein